MAYGGTKLSGLPVNTAITGGFKLLATGPDGKSYSVTISEMMADTGATGVSADSDNALSAGTDGKAYLAAASLGGGSGAVTSVAIGGGSGKVGAVDITGAEVKAAYEAEADTNAFTDAEQAKLAGLPTSAVAATGGSMSGVLSFTGSDHAGLQVISLTTSERDLLTGVAGQIIWNETTGQFEGHSGTDWISLDPRLSAGAGDIEIAADTDHWANTAGFYVATAQSLGEMEVVRTLTVTAGNCGINGALFQNAFVLADSSNVDFNTAAGLTAKPRRVYVTADGASRTVTATGFGVLSNIDTGAVIADGDTGVFEMYRLGGLDYITYLGARDYLLGGSVADASETAKGIIEIATQAEVNAGTDTVRAVTAGTIAGSYAGTEVVEIEVFSATTNLITGDNKARFYAPAKINGMKLVRVAAFVETAGTTGTTDIQIHNVTDAVDVLSTKITIDSGETSTATAAIPAAINTANDDIATNDKWRIDIDAVSSTPPQGLTVVLEFRL